MAVDVILGLQWGDEGKGKIVDYLAKNYQIVCRFQGGPNAGHTLKIEGNKYVLHTIPSGIFRDGIENIIGNGVVIDPITLNKEIDKLKETGIEFMSRLLVSNKAHLILPTHRYLDAASEASKGKQKIGSTLKGIGPTYMDKTGRNGLRVGDIFQSSFNAKYKSLRDKHLALLRQYPPIEFDLEGEEEKWFTCLETIKQLKAIDCEYHINQAIKEGKQILAEGAQGSMLDIDFGTYPYVTSSNTITSGVCSGLGIAPQQIRDVIGITKAYCTRVGGGPFPTELFDEDGAKLGEIGMEFGATTGRPRRCGWIDIPQLKYTLMINGVTQIVLTKLDVLDHFEEVKAGCKYSINGNETDQLPYDLTTQEIEPVYCVYDGWNKDMAGTDDFDKLPQLAKDYVSELEKLLGMSIKYVSTGPERKSLIVREV